MTIPVSVVILTFNEEKNIKFCLDSIKNWAQEIFIVDSGSLDRTVEMAKQYTNQVCSHELINQAQQFNWALENLPIRTEWVLRLDADEFLLPELRSEISQAISNADVKINGFYIKRRVYFKGNWIKHGGYYPTWLLRLFRYGKAHSEQLEMDEHIVLFDGQVSYLKNDFIDYNHKDLAFWTGKHEKFAEREAAALMRQAHQANQIGHQQLTGQPARKRWLKGNVYARSPLFIRAFIYFLYRYFILLGFLDGKPGLIFHFLQGFWYRFYVDAKIWEAQQQQQQGLAQAKQPALANEVEY
ncbi:MAG: glycosyltransferase family 2 protein [Nitrospira sp.]|nr:glycosyltransferase family 2 protein [Nitrospira sp.]